MVLYLASVLGLILVDKVHQKKPLEKMAMRQNKMSDQKKSTTSFHILLPERLITVKTQNSVENVTFFVTRGIRNF